MIPDFSASGGNASLAIFKRRYPYHSATNFYSAENLAALKGYALWKNILYFLVFLLIFVLPLVYAFVLRQVYVLLYLIIKPAGAHFYAITILAFLLSGMVAMLMSIGRVSPWLLRLAYGTRQNLFMDYYNNEQGYDTNAASGWVARIMNIILPFALLINFGAHLYVRADEITYQPGFYLKASHHPYSTVRSIQYIDSTDNSNHKLELLRSYRVVFNNGDMITDGEYFGDSRAMQPFITEIQEKTKLPIDTIPFLHFEDSDAKNPG